MYVVGESRGSSGNAIIRWYLPVGDVSKIVQGFCSFVSMHSCLCIRKQVMLPFSSNVLIIFSKSWKDLFARILNVYEVFCMKDLSCALKMGCTFLSKKPQSEWFLLNIMHE